MGNHQRVILTGIHLADLGPANFVKAPADFAQVHFGINANHNPPIVVPPPVVIPVDTSGQHNTDQQATNKSDVFSYTWNWGAHNIVHQFSVAQDKIDLKSFWTSFDQIKLHNDAHGNAVIDLTTLNNQTITLDGVSVSSLSANNFSGLTGTMHVDNGTSTPVIPPVIPAPVVNPPVIAGTHEYSYTWHWGAKDVVKNFDVLHDTVNLKSFWISYDQITIHNNAQGYAVIDLTGLNNQTITLDKVLSSQLSAKNLVGVTGTFNHATATPTHDVSAVTGSTQPVLSVVNHDVNETKLVASSGAHDVFNFTWNWGSNKVITGFNPSQDTVDLTRFLTSSDHVSIHNNALGHAVIDLTALNHQTITLLGVSAENLHEGHGGNVIL